MINCFDFTNEPLYTLSVHYEKNKPLSEYTEKIILDLQNQNITNGYNEKTVAEIVLLSGSILEKIISETLFRINPALVFEKIDNSNIDIIIGKKTKEEFDKEQKIRTVSITKKIDIFKKLNHTDSENYDIKSFFLIRNKFAHPISLEKIDLENVCYILSTQALSFIIKYVKVKNELSDSLASYSKTFMDKFDSDLLTYIRRFSEKEYTYLDHRLGHYLMEDEEIVAEQLPCPACGQNTTFIYQDIADGEVVDNHSYCSTCELQLSKSQLIRISDSPITFLIKGSAEMYMWEGLMDGLAL